MVKPFKDKFNEKGEQKFFWAGQSYLPQPISWCWSEITTCTILGDLLLFFFNRMVEKDRGYISLSTKLWDLGESKWRSPEILGLESSSQ